MKNVLRLPAVGLSAVGILLAILLKFAKKSLILTKNCFLIEVYYAKKACSYLAILNIASNVILIVS